MFRSLLARLVRRRNPAVARGFRRRPLRLGPERLERRQLLAVTIYDVDDLQEMANDLTEDYVLGNDIDASETGTWNWDAGEEDYLGFDPIGEAGTEFEGTFDGQGFTISGLTIDRPAESYVGLFGYIDSTSALVEDVGLIDVAITGDDYVGALVGFNVYGDITDVYVSGGTVAGDDSSSTGRVGGLAGCTSGWSVAVTDCHAMVEVSGYAHVGGLLGRAVGGVISDCYATGDVDATGYSVGGLIGSTWNTDVDRSYASGDVYGGGSTVGGLAGVFPGGGDLTNSYATGTVTSDYQYAGGLVGKTSGSGTTIVNCYATGAVTADDYAGGFAGELYDSGSISYSYATGGATGTDAGGFLGEYTSGTLTNCWWYSEVPGQIGIGSGSTGGLTEEDDVTDFYDPDEQEVYWTDGDFEKDLYWDFTAPADWLEFSDGFPRLEYEWSTSISTALQLQNMQLDLDNDYSLANDINAIGFREFQPVGDSTNAFTGTLDGNDYTISGLTITSNDEQYVGLFGYADGISVQDLGLSDLDVDVTRSETGTLYAAGLLGYDAGGPTISNSHATGSIVASTTNSVQVISGGLAANVEDDVSITGSYANCTMDVDADHMAVVGGLIGQWTESAGTSGSVSECYALGTITADSANTGLAGGLIGYGRIYNSGSVTDSDLTLSESYAAVPVTATSSGIAYVGGLVGYFTVIGSSNADSNAYIDDCYAVGDAMADSSFAAYAGGLLAYCSTYYDSALDMRHVYALGNATATHDNDAEAAGGLVGSIREYAGSTIGLSNSYATGVAEGYYEGGLIGINLDGTISTCYWFNHENTDGVGGGSGTGVIKAPNKEAFFDADYAVYTTGNTWDFTNDWEEDVVQGYYPFLNWELDDGIVGAVETAAELQAIMDDPYKAYRLIGNIDVDDSITNFDPLGDGTTPFNGRFSGSGYTISDLDITRPTETEVGLFGRTGASAVLDNVLLKDVQIAGGSYVGALAGRSDGKIIGGFVTTYLDDYTDDTTAFVKGGGDLRFYPVDAPSSYLETYYRGGAYLGGLVGFNDGTVLDSGAEVYVAHNATVSGDTSYVHTVGGLVGQNDNGAIVETSYAQGDVILPYVAMHDDGADDSPGTADDTEYNKSIGGLVGVNAGLVKGYDTSYVQAYGKVQGLENVAGLVGRNLGTLVGGRTVDDGSRADDITGARTVGGLIGKLMNLNDNNPGIVSDSYSSRDIAVTTITVPNNLGGVFDIPDDYANIGGLVGHSEGGLIDTCYATGDVSGSTTHERIGGLAGKVKHTQLADDSWDHAYAYDHGEGRGTPIVTDSYATGAVDGIENIGGLIGKAEFDPVITTCYATTGAVSSTTDRTGGLVGQVAGDTTYIAQISDCYATGTVTGDDDLGGLVGVNTNGTISECYASGIVSGDKRVGGLVGSNTNAASIADSYWQHATNVISGDDDVGGLVGVNQNGTISDCYAAGDIDAGATANANQRVGGLVGYNLANSGGTATIEDCGAYSTVDVGYDGASGSDQDEFIGGLVGYNHADGANATAEIKDSVAQGDVDTGKSDDEKVGGFVGYNHSNGSGADAVISDCYTAEHEDRPTSNYVVDTGTGDDKHIGGFAGRSRLEVNTGGAAALIDRCYAGGNVATDDDDDDNVGGFVGQLKGNGAQIKDSFALGTVDAGSGSNTDIGGFVGHKDGTVTHPNCYRVNGPADDVPQEDRSVLLEVVDGAYTHDVFDNWTFSDNPWNEVSNDDNGYPPYFGWWRVLVATF